MLADHLSRPTKALLQDVDRLGVVLWGEGDSLDGVPRRPLGVGQQIVALSRSLLLCTLASNWAQNEGNSNTFPVNFGRVISGNLPLLDRTAGMPALTLLLPIGPSPRASTILARARAFPTR
ncbi:hypothetical protein T12_6282 [Trichinella patagoniensis]|uniref:Uncharacterized protein n=1 Tax=Trichinella patagoniensis TaxID=990121 RepID=A0A0V0Z1T1_9BILA|nr:hypothetical protein T12_6282 [Trichinella patagoniensis]